MRRITFLLVAIATLASIVACIVPASEQADKNSAPIYLSKIPPGYRDWKLISVAHEEGKLHSFAAVLGNDVAIEAYRDGKLPFPDGTIIAALHYSHVPSDEKNKVFGQAQSFVPGPLQTSSSWSRTRKSTRRREVGGLDTSAQMASHGTRRY